MPRKKSPGGRALPKTPQSQLLLQVSKVNRRLNRLERAGVYGRYASKKFIRFANESRNISYKRSRKNKIQILNVKKLTPAETRMISKKISQFAKNKTSSPIGLNEVADTTKAKIKQSLKNYKEDIDDEDVEDFYEMTADDDYRYFADKIGDSQLYALIQESIEKNYTQNDFIETLSQYITVNNADVRKKAERLYNKYVKGM